MDLVIEKHNGIFFRAFVRGEGNWAIGRTPAEALGDLVLALMIREGNDVLIKDIYRRDKDASCDNEVSLAITERE